MAAPCYAGGMPNLRTIVFTGPDITLHLASLARLRMAVFRDWPYLYDGNPAYEAGYLADFANAPSAALVVAFDGETAVGCSSCVRLSEEEDAIRAPFIAAGIAPERVFYFGESVLLPAYRGTGIGVRFFEEREAHARRIAACDFAAFCAVVRPDDHPLRPPGAVRLDAFWGRRGFTAYPDLVCRMAWKQVDGPEKVENTLGFWLKSLTGAPLP